MISSLTGRKPKKEMDDVEPIKNRKMKGKDDDDENDEEESDNVKRVKKRKRKQKEDEDEENDDIGMENRIKIICQIIKNSKTNKKTSFPENDYREPFHDQEWDEENEENRTFKKKRKRKVLEDIENVPPDGAIEKNNFIMFNLIFKESTEF